eukprot:CAMPEP_0168368528 /NCGR_PEP_ID=MMETSP0228-20121227/6296_1 /TAXON_ID=133427 /ORGANISM="Protoceratium reticulatum, Strain CCCM 535 (=CCMP 1889)" /LENGTH=34 /DNA_ID= /DNA_START= /DNA_END= /DNA_ORIENTATION=
MEYMGTRRDFCCILDESHQIQVPEEEASLALAAA